MPQTKGQDLLFELLEHLAMVIAHSDEFLDLLILGAGNMNRAVCSVCQALRDICGIASRHRVRRSLDRTVIHRYDVFDTLLSMR